VHKENNKKLSKAALDLPNTSSKLRDTLAQARTQWENKGEKKRAGLKAAITRA
jgi:hypothetical protein